MTKLSSLLFVSLLSFYAFSATDSDKLDKVLDFSGTVEQMTRIPEDTKASLDSIIPLIKDEATKKKQIEVNKALYTSMTKFRSKLDFKEELANALTEESLNQLYEWYISPLAKKITKLETEEQKLGIQGLNEYVQSLEKNLPSQQRSQYIGMIVKESKVLVNAFEGQKIIALGVKIRENNSLHADKKLKVVDIVKQVEMESDQKNKQVANIIVLQYFRAFESLSNEELLQYINFLKSQPAQRLMQITSQGSIKFYQLVGKDLTQSSSDRKTASE